MAKKVVIDFESELIEKSWWLVSLVTNQKVQNTFSWLLGWSKFRSALSMFIYWNQNVCAYDAFMLQISNEFPADTSIDGPMELQ